MSTALVKLSENLGVSTDEVSNVVKGMILSAKNQHGAVATDAELTVVAGVCAKYDLNPLVKEAHAFISGGKLSVMIGVDGWIKIMNRQPDFDGFEQEDKFDSNGSLLSVTTKIYVKGRKYPTPHTEYMSEAVQAKSDAWKKYPNRMLSGKSLGQCVRKAFGISEVIDDDEAGRITSSSPRVERDITPRQTAQPSQTKIPAPDVNELKERIKEAGDEATLRAVCTSIRVELEASGWWDDHKETVVQMNRDQKSLIAAMESQSEEFEELEDLDEFDGFVSDKLQSEDGELVEDDDVPFE
jgi:hypothetical protein